MRPITLDTGQTVGLGWLPDRPDSRDHRLALPKPAEVQLDMDLREWMGGVYNQQATNSCTGQAMASVLDSTSLGAGHPEFRPSAMFAYYSARELEGQTRYDGGAFIRDVVKGAAQRGICREDLWPQSSSATRRPSQSAYNDAANHRIIEYLRVDVNREAVLETLNAWYPIICGFLVYESMTTQQVSRTGNVPMPQRNERIMGGHAVVLTGYSLDQGIVRFKNSWSTGWGDGGFGTFPLDFITNPEYADDFWVIRLSTES